MRSLPTRGDRQWSDDEKQLIIAEASRPDVNISAVARRHGIKPSLLFRWRRLAREAEAGTTTPAFVPITLALPSVCTETAPEALTTPSSSIPTTRPHAERTQHDDVNLGIAGAGDLVLPSAACGPNNVIFAPMKEVPAVAAWHTSVQLLNQRINDWHGMGHVGGAGKKDCLMGQSEPCVARIHCQRLHSRSIPEQKSFYQCENL
jgi:transposase-like protein